MESENTNLGSGYFWEVLAQAGPGQPSPGAARQLGSQPVGQSISLLFCCVFSYGIMCFLNYLPMISKDH